MEPPLSAPGGPALPLWKREILERKRAKLAGPPAGGGPEPGGGGRAGPAPPEERLVLADSLGPLRENPFMRLESERRRLRQGLPGGARRGAGRPLQELLELYSAVPGIRTIRADNILIIESQPDADAACFAAGEGARDPLPAASPRGRDPLRDLLARKGSALTEIRAAQVFVYEPTEPDQAGRVSRLLQKFDQWPRGRRRRSRDAEPGPLVAVPNSPVSPPARQAPVPAVSTAAPQRVPVPVAIPPNRRVPGSPVSAAVPRPLPLPGSPVSPVAPRPVPLLLASPPNRRAPGSPVSPAAPQPVPVNPAAPRPAPVLPASPPNRRAPGSPVSPVAPRPVPVLPASPPNRRALGSPVSPVAPQPVPGSLGISEAYGFLHKISSNSFTVTPRGLRPSSCAPLTNGPLEHSASPGGRSHCVKAPPEPSPSVSLARDNTRPKPERSKEIQPSQSSATPSPLQPLSASVLRDGGSFEICPAPKPDLATIPAHDLQAQALANLRLNSRNSFLFVPRRGGGQRLTESAGAMSPLKPQCEQQGEPITPPQAPQELLVPVTYIDDDIVELDTGDLPQEMGPAAGLKDSEQPQEATSDLSAIPLYIPNPASSAFQQRSGNTFTIVPKRKPPSSGVEVDSGASKAQQSEEEDNEESRSKGKTLGSPGAPQLDLGLPLKKRYPTVNEIEVIGGYLSLERSCMSKMGSRRKKMKISFNETSLQTTFEYPSESSLVEEEEEESSSEAEDDEEDKPSSLFIPRPTCTMHANVPSSGFSSYTPKHAVEFSRWQEQEYEEQPASAAGPPLKEANAPGNQVTLTPADQSGLSDFSSEPALYF
ncbi:taperin isoform X2 [Chelonia mydas]|uniref:taperin isoform X2 n=1 Tax=Chelonia mydas TaxID=8469 RepID=UPI001CAA085A|nr:taperin isoform X2 [Chelonia mydas]